MTLGLAGHASEVIKQMNPGDIFIGFDADERNLQLAQQKLDQLQIEIKSTSQVRILLIRSNFVELRAKLREHDIHHVTGIYYDLGVSSAHFDEADRGFSLRLE